jgi:hypothetical protein
MRANDSVQPRVWVVGVCHDVAPAAFASHLHRAADGLRVALAGIIVDNLRERQTALADDRFAVIAGSNSDLDFSGYQEGLKRLVETQPDAAGRPVLFVNDSLLTKHAGAAIAQRVLELHRLLEQLQVPAIAGKRDPYRSIVSRNPWSGHAGYVSTFCFLLNARALPMLEALPLDATRDGLDPALPIDDDAWAAGLPALMREFVRAHLTYVGSPFSWPRGAPAERGLIARKARCVYFEHRLSGTIGVDGAIVPINTGPRSSLQIALHEWVARAARVLGIGRP